MKRCLLLLSIITLMVVSASAQRFSYDVIASVSFDAQTQQYGKIQPLNMRIVKDGNFHWGRSLRFASGECRSR